MSTRTRRRSGSRRGRPAAGLWLRGPSQSRVDLVAAADGRRPRPGGRARAAEPDRPDRGLHRLRRPGRRAPATSSRSAKIAPHLVAGGRAARGRAVARRGGPPRPGRARSARADRGRSSRSRCPAADARGSRRDASARRGSGATLARDLATWPTTPRHRRRRRSAGVLGGPGAADLVLTAGAASHRPGRPVLRRDRARSAGGSSAMASRPIPGSMLWLARVGRLDRARPADLRRLLEGDRRRPAAAPARRPASRRLAGRVAPPGPRRHPEPLDALPLPRLRSRSRRAGRVGRAPGTPTASRCRVYIDPIRPRDAAARSNRRPRRTSRSRRTIEGLRPRSASTTTSPIARSPRPSSWRSSWTGRSCSRARRASARRELAKVLADTLGARLIRLQCYEGLDVTTAVYEWNYPRQMLEIRLLEARGEIGNGDRPRHLRARLPAQAAAAPGARGARRHRRRCC